jgi:TPR repeat protein
MARVVRNYMSGREGFARDYPEARRWIDSLIIHYQLSDSEDAEQHVSELRAELRYLDRLDGIAGGRLVGPEELEALGARADADAQYDYAMQLLAGAGAERRAEAVARLEAAAGLGHAEAAWRLVAVYERGLPGEVDAAAARRALERAASLHHYDAVRELAARYEHGKDGYPQDLPRAIEMYEAALEAGHDNRYGWNLSDDVFNHFPWLESRLEQAKLKLESRLAAAGGDASGVR